MKILFLTQVLPFPLDAGPKVRAYYVLRHLAQTHEVTLLSFVRTTDTPEAIDHLRQICAAVHTVPMPRGKLRDGAHLMQSLVTDQPFLIARDWVPAMAVALRRVVDAVGQVDAVHADQLWMAPYALAAKKMTSQAKPPMTVLDQHNAVYKIPERLSASEQNPLKRALLAHEARKLARYEVETCRQFDHVVWVTQEDFDAVQSQVKTPGAPVPDSGVIPICVDTDTTPVIRRQATPRRVTFLGGLHYPPNADGICWFAAEVFGRVLAAVPDAVLTVIGKQPPQRLQQLGIPPANLDVTGYVADPRGYLEETAAFIVPLHAGGGMRVKILDAWALGMPLVSTSIGAEGISTRPGCNILLADRPTDFSQAVVVLLTDRAMSNQLAENGRQWVTQHYSWRTVYRQWCHIYASIEPEASY